MAAIEITEETPMMMPSTVKADRTFDERSVARAARKFSRACDAVMMAIYSDLKATIGSRFAARSAG